jgi:hypothetical protein
MTDLNFASLQQFLPDESIRWDGFGAPVYINLNQLVDDSNLTPESLILESFGRLLDALVAVQNSVNAARSTASPPLSPINLVEKSISSHNGNPVYQWAFQVEIEASASLNNPINPLEN